MVLGPVEVEILPDDTMNRPNAAKYLGISLSRLNQWASHKFGPKFILGRKTFYRQRDLDAWKETRASW